MRLKYYGTAAAEGWPALFCACPACEEARRRGGRNIRTRAQACIDDTLLIDFGPDTYLHTIHSGLRLDQIRTCLITHSHEDHLCRDEIGYRAHDFAARVLPGRFLFYGSRTVCDVLAATPQWARDPERIGFEELPPYETRTIEGYLVTPLLAAHGIGETPPIVCYIYAIEKDGKRILYAHDTGFFPDATWEWLRNRPFDLVSMDCTTQRIREGRNHMGFENVIEVKKKLEEIGCGKPGTRWIINHFSHNGGVLHEEMAERMAPYGIEPSWDGMEIRL